MANFPSPSSLGDLVLAGSGATTVAAAFNMDQEISSTSYNGTTTELLDSDSSSSTITTSDGDSYNLTTDDLFRDYDLALTQSAAVFCVIFIVLGVPGNLITIIALARCKKVSFSRSSPFHFPCSFIHT